MEDLVHIVNGCINNEHKYQKLLYERFYGYALKVVFRYIYRYEKAVDTANDGFVKIFRNFNHFEYSNNGDLERMLMGWMKKIMINTAIDELRKTNLVPEIRGLEDHAWDVQDSTPSAEQQLLYKELISQLRNLSPAYRVVFNMAVIDGYSHQEIADALGISAGTSKSNLFKAKAQLQKILNKQNTDMKGLIYAISK
ncbi:RNA polymerase sigma factor [Danxiaibacter flavus]|uniref:RNA polymerase sigma factor n=1 Tax=Danxiaibacter flavus TaxID=3049108 RepID=A0ABV3ZFJ4_9BACT|nr:RNA polymerase sigma factor [Chitinophagaceae bacterium DXS]